MGLFGEKKATRMQLYHYDNTDIEFRRLPIIGQAACELDDKGDPRAAWIDFNANTYPFDGYKSIPADAIQPAHSRHYHYEVHNVLPPDLRPNDDGTLDCDYISIVADTRASEINKAPKPRTIWEKITVTLMIGFILELVIWGIQIATS